MKKIILFLLIFFASTMIIYLNSCKKSNTASNNEVDVNKEYTLTEKALLDDNIYLPKGTTWQYVSKDGGEVKFTLPKGYAFLQKDLNNGTFLIDPGAGGYSCTCSKNGSCKVFYQKDLGYGCLQNTCTGECTGKATSSLKKQILGVLNTENDQLELEQIVNKASLSEEGKKAFFQLPQVQAEIKKIMTLFMPILQNRILKILTQINCLPVILLVYFHSLVNKLDFFYQKMKAF